jgi:hypothetical protein
MLKPRDAKTQDAKADSKQPGLGSKFRPPLITISEGSAASYPPSGGFPQAPVSLRHPHCWEPPLLLYVLPLARLSPAPLSLCDSGGGAALHSKVRMLKLWFYLWPLEIIRDSARRHGPGWRVRFDLSQGEGRLRFVLKCFSIRFWKVELPTPAPLFTPCPPPSAPPQVSLSIRPPGPLEVSKGPRTWLVGGGG